MSDKATFRIVDLRLKAIVGIEDWERKKKQDVVVNVTFEADVGQAAVSDDIADTVNYKTMTKQIIRLVEESRCYLLEKLASEILAAVAETKGVSWASVQIDKPGALRHADSVSVEVSTQG